MPLNVGSVYADFQFDIKPLQRGIAQARRELQQLEKQSRSSALQPTRSVSAASATKTDDTAKALQRVADAQIRAKVAARDYAGAQGLVSNELSKTSENTQRYFNLQSQMSRIANRAATDQVSAANKQRNEQEKLFNAQVRAANAQGRYGDSLRMIKNELSGASQGTRRYAELQTMLATTQGRQINQQIKQKQGFAGSIAELGRYVGAVGLATGGLALFTSAVNTLNHSFDMLAKNEQNILRLQTVLGGEASARIAMQQGAKFANDFGYSIAETNQKLAESAQIMRLTGSNAESLLQVIGVLEMKSPEQKAIGGAAIALNELITGDAQSIRKRFEVGSAQMSVFNKEMAKGADFATALKTALDQTGYTSEVLANRMKGAAGAQNLLSKVWDDFYLKTGQAIGPFWTKVVNGAAVAVKWLGDTLPGAISSASQTFEGFWKSIVNPVEALKAFGVSVFANVAGIIDLAKQTVFASQSVQDFVSKLTELVRLVVNFAPDTVATAFKDMADGAQDGTEATKMYNEIVKSGSDVDGQRSASLTALYNVTDLVLKQTEEHTKLTSQAMLGELGRKAVIEGLTDAQIRAAIQADNMNGEIEEAAVKSQVDAAKKFLQEEATNRLTNSLKESATALVNQGAAGEQQAISMLASANATDRLTGALALLEIQARKTKAQETTKNIISEMTKELGDAAEAQQKYSLGVADNSDKLKILDARISSARKGSADYYDLLLERKGVEDDISKEAEQAAKDRERDAKAAAKDAEQLHEKQLDYELSVAKSAEQLSILRKELSGLSTTDERYYEIRKKIAEVEKDISEEKKKQYESSLDARKLAIEDARKRIEEQKDAKKATRVLARSGRADMRQLADLRLQEIAVDQEKRRYDINQKIADAGGALPNMPYPAASPVVASTGNGRQMPGQAPIIPAMDINKMAGQITVQGPFYDKLVVQIDGNEIASSSVKVFVEGARRLAGTGV